MSLMFSRLECEPLVIEAVESVGCTLYALFLTPGKTQHLTILIEKPEGANVDDCEKVFDQIRFTCGRTDNYLKNKSIEVATPGLDRLLLYPEHFIASVGRWIEVRINTSDQPKKTLRGCLLHADSEGIELKDEDDTVHLIRYNDVAKGRWIFVHIPPSREEA